MTGGSLAVDSDGLALLEFRARIDSDPYGAFSNWNSNDTTPCFWWGIHCVDGKVQMLDLTALSLEGTLAPELGKLSHLRSLLGSLVILLYPLIQRIFHSVLYKNRFSGAIPKEFGELMKLELLDLRENDLGGTIPAEIGKMLSLKRLLHCDNKLEGSIPSGLGRLNLLSELQFDENLTSMSATEIGCVNRKFGLCIWQSSLKQLSRVGSLLMPIRGALIHYLIALPLAQQKDSLAEHQDDCCQDVPCEYNYLPNWKIELLEQSKNLPARPAASMSSNNRIISLPTNRSSGSFPVVPKAKNKHRPSPIEFPPPEMDTTDVEEDAEHASGSGSSSSWKYLIVIPCVAIFLGFLVMYRKRAAKTISPWKTGLSGQLQKAFVTGVPKVNRAELETACEDFSNIIDTIGGCKVYKGTLSSGVEIAVAATSISSLKDWSKSSEKAYRRKIDKLSRINHKNYVNLIGYCEEDEPFNRMMVFEYAPNGTLFEHLHVKEMEHLDWNARMRIIMGVAYCLQYMHHDLNPPLAHPSLSSSSIYLADDYAAKAKAQYNKAQQDPVQTQYSNQAWIWPNRALPCATVGPAVGACGCRGPFLG
ncbi:putative LRR receptor-like serine/threonine-protein kinase MRH1 [Hibiscus syriacus]|uniref:LRR receptor-like serine/threonine-protein kinase MRH1 n=1 Tax=Hibiscus syriacus TaxID=106335 RepID=A0A6A3ANS6_HIBSY|nr:putative LRR receptor-like serine/threonine-protein kinase MRH1 [Hibiscus syriacus]